MPIRGYLAEDALPRVRQRVDSMARHPGLSLQQVENHVITAPTLRLDRQPHLNRQAPQGVHVFADVRPMFAPQAERIDAVVVSDDDHLHGAEQTADGMTEAIQRPLMKADCRCLLLRARRRARGVGPWQPPPAMTHPQEETWQCSRHWEPFW